MLQIQLATKPRLITPYFFLDKLQLLIDTHTILGIYTLTTGERK